MNVRKDVKELFATFAGSAIELIVEGDCVYRLEFTEIGLRGKILRAPLKDSWFVELSRTDAELAIYDGYVEPAGYLSGKYRTNMPLSVLGKFRGLVAAVRSEFAKL